MPLIREASGRLAPTRASDVRARVPGVLQKRLYKERQHGQGRPAAVPDRPGAVRARSPCAEANLAQAQAAGHQRRTSPRSATASCREQALVSRAELDDAEAAGAFDRRAVSAGAAQLETARINLGYATVTAPIAGRAEPAARDRGRARRPGRGDAAHYREQIDPIYVNFDQPAIGFERLRREQAAGARRRSPPAQGRRVQLLLADGTAVRARRHARLLRFQREPAHRRGRVARHRPEPRPAAAARHVRDRAPHGGHDEQRLPGAAGRGCSATAQGAVSCSSAGADGKVVAEARRRRDSVGDATGSSPSGLADGDRHRLRACRMARPGIEGEGGRPRAQKPAGGRRRASRTPRPGDGAG